MRIDGCAFDLDADRSFLWSFDHATVEELVFVNESYGLDRGLARLRRRRGVVHGERDQLLCFFESIAHRSFSPSNQTPVVAVHVSIICFGVSPFFARM